MLDWSREQHNYNIRILALPPRIQQLTQIVVFAVVIKICQDLSAVRLGRLVRATFTQIGLCEKSFLLLSMLGNILTHAPCADGPTNGLLCSLNLGGV